jgi:hypothetical protein
VTGSYGKVCLFCYVGHGINTVSMFLGPPWYCKLEMVFHHPLLKYYLLLGQDALHVLCPPLLFAGLSIDPCEGIILDASLTHFVASRNPQAGSIE